MITGVSVGGGVGEKVADGRAVGVAVGNTVGGAGVAVGGTGATNILLLPKGVSVL